MPNYNVKKRKNTRSRLWTDIVAILDIEDPFSHVGRHHLRFKGNIENLGSSGMFVITDEPIPVPAKVEITIDFDPNRPGMLCIKAAGETVHKTSTGVGVCFTKIDLQQLQRCILHRMNRDELGEKE